MTLFYKHFLKGNNYFHVMIVFTFIVFMSNLVNLVMHFYFYGFQEESYGLYMNLSNSPDNAICSSYPFDGHFPYKIIYKFGNDKYTFNCPVPILYLLLGHGLVSSVVILLTFITFYLGNIYVHWSSIPLVIVLIVSNSIIFLIGIADKLIIDSSMNYCQNELFNLIDFSKSKIQPISMDCSDNHFEDFAYYEIFAGFLGLIYSVIVLILYIFFRRKKKEMITGYKEQENSSQISSDHSEIVLETVIDSSNENSENVNNNAINNQHQ